MEYESGTGGLTYRNVYGLEKAETVIYGVSSSQNGNSQGGSGLIQYRYADKNGSIVLATKDPGKSVASEQVIKLYVHQDRLGSTVMLTDNVNKRVVIKVNYPNVSDRDIKEIIELWNVQK